MYAVMIEFGDRYWNKACANLMQVVKFIAEVFDKEGEQCTKLWIEWTDV